MTPATFLLLTGLVSVFLIGSATGAALQRHSQRREQESRQIKVFKPPAEWVGEKGTRPLAALSGRWRAAGSPETSAVERRTQTHAPVDREGRAVFGSRAARPSTGRHAGTHVRLLPGRGIRISRRAVAP